MNESQALQGDALKKFLVGSWKQEITDLIKNASEPNLPLEILYTLRNNDQLEGVMSFINKKTKELGRAMISGNWYVDRNVLTMRLKLSFTKRGFWGLKTTEIEQIAIGLVRIINEDSYEVLDTLGVGKDIFYRITGQLINDSQAVLRQTVLREVNAKYNDGGTTLISASLHGNIEQVKELLAANTDMNEKDNDDVTALMCASELGNIEMVKILLAAKANVNAKDNNGSTALIKASRRGHGEVVWALLAAKAGVYAKADVNVKDNNGVTALMAAAINNHVEVVQTLLAADADVNAKKKDGETALMCASNEGHVEVVQTLLAAKADVNAKDNYGVTAMMVASMKGNAKVVKLLKQAGAKK